MTSWLAALPEPEQSRSAVLIFSAKETFYKCQYGVTRQWLEFDDVALDIPPGDGSAGLLRSAAAEKNRVALS